MLINEKLPNIPETWNTLEEFTYWYLQSEMPLMPPYDAKIYVTDLSYSTIIFRKDVYQVEQYFIKPNAVFPPHTHVNFENILVFLSGEFKGKQGTSLQDFDNTSDWKSFGYNEPIPNNIWQPSVNYKTSGKKLIPGTFHSIQAGPRGCCLLSIEKWVTQEKLLSSATLAYEGSPVGPIHEAALAGNNQP